MLVKKSFVEYINEDSELKKIIKNGFPQMKSDELDKDIREKLFWPRNKIPHLGFSEFGPEAATRCYAIAALGLQVLSKMNVWAGQNT